MKQRYLLLALIISQLTFAQLPNWTNANQRSMKYPKSKFLTGYAQYKNQDKLNQDVFLEKLRGYAQKDLVNSVRTTIETASVLNSQEVNGQMNELFMVSSVSTSGMSIAGIKFETYYEEKSKVGYVFAYANRQEVFSYYINMLKQDISKLQQKYQTASGLKNQQTKQIKELNGCYPIFRNIEESQSILFALKPSISDEEIKLQFVKKLSREVESLKANLENTEVTNINEAASLLALALKDQISEDLKTARLQNLSYQDTKMGSSFSRRFSSTLEQKLSTESGINIVANVSNNNQAKVNNLLTGTYWEEGENLRIIVVLKDIVANKTLASAETKLSLTWLNNNGVNYKPENFQQAYSTMQAFKANEVGGGGLSAEIWTNKGDENLIYQEGDLLKLFVRVNRESYIRVIYHMADGSRVLLVDNYYISSDKVNKVYELPFEFECAEPFGVETLQLNAQTKEFDPLNVTQQYGYDFISDGLPQILVNTRGFKKVNNDVLKAEKRVIITTMRE